MSVRAKKMHWRDGGDPVVTIEVVGVHDVYRLAHHLEHGQCEFAAMGRKMKRGLRRKLAPSQWEWLGRYMHGDGGFR